MYKKFLLNLLCIIFVIQTSTFASQGRVLIEASSLSSYLLIEKIKNFLEQDRSIEQNAGSMAALLLVKKSQSILRDIVDGFNQGSIHNLIIEQKFMQAYDAGLPTKMRPKDLRLFSKNIVGFDLFLNDFTKQKRWSLSSQELALINKIQQLNFLLTKGILHRDFLPIETGDYIADVLWHKPCEFAVRHKKAILSIVAVAAIAGISYYVVYPSYVRRKLRNENIEGYDFYQIPGLIQEGGDCAIFALVQAMILAKADGDRAEAEKIIAELKKNSKYKEIIEEMTAIVSQVQDERNNKADQDRMKTETIIAERVRASNNEEIKNIVQAYSDDMQQLDEQGINEIIKKNNLNLGNDLTLDKKKEILLSKFITYDKKVREIAKANGKYGYEGYDENLDLGYSYQSLQGVGRRGEWAGELELQHLIDNIDTIQSLKSAGLLLDESQKQRLRIYDDIYNDLEDDVILALKRDALSQDIARGKASVILRTGGSHDTATHWICVYFPHLNENGGSVNLKDKKDAIILDSLSISKYFPLLGFYNRTNNSNVNKLFRLYKNNTK
jgi:hypothetical protein